MQILDHLKAFRDSLGDQGIGGNICAPRLQTQRCIYYFVGGSLGPWLTTQKNVLLIAAEETQFA
jgi:hypothetical protein